METINFSTNWNQKLTCNAFTTIRLHNPSKYQKGRTYEIRQKDSLVAYATAVDVRSFTIDQLNEWRALLDTGYSAAETRGILEKMYKKVDWATQKLDVILLLKVKKWRR
jgi:hypothetical protein